MVIIFGNEDVAAAVDGHAERLIELGAGSRPPVAAKALSTDASPRGNRVGLGSGGGQGEPHLGQRGQPRPPGPSRSYGHQQAAKVAAQVARTGPRRKRRGV